MANSVRDATRLLDTIHGPDAHDITTYGTPPSLDTESAVGVGVDGLRLALVEECLEEATDGVTERVEEAATALAEAGARVERVSISPVERAKEVIPPIVGHEFVTLLRDYGHVAGPGTGYDESWRRAIDDLGATGSLGDNVYEQVLIAEALKQASDGRHYVATQSARGRIVASLHEVLSDYDALLTPTTNMTAPEFDTVTDLDDLIDVHANTCPFNLSGHPAASVPCGTVDGKPVEFQTVGDWHEEPTVVRAASAVEQVG